MQIPLEQQQIPLEQQIADYQQMVETTRQDGRALHDRLKQEGWQMVDSLLECNRNPCAIHPDLWADLGLMEDLLFDEEEEFYHLGRDLSEDELEMIVELPVIDPDYGWE